MFTNLAEVRRGKRPAGPVEDGLPWMFPCFYYELCQSLKALDFA